MTKWTTAAEKVGLYYKIAQNDVRSVIRDRPGFLPIFCVVLSKYDNFTEYSVLEPLREAVKER